VGGHQPLRANVRVIAATHQNLEERVRQGAFREDLFHRLNVIRLRLPPLRERREDVGALTRFFLQKSARELGVEAKRITTAAVERLMDFDFPGNVRQLENICHWLTVMAPSQVIEAKDLPPEVGQASAPMAVESSTSGLSGGPMATLSTASAMSAPAAGGASPAVAEVVRPEGLAWSMAGLDWLAQLEAEARRRLEGGEGDVWQALTDQFEARLIETALDLTRGRRIEAAQRLGIGRNTITRKIDELGLDRKRGPG